MSATASTIAKSLNYSSDLSVYWAFFVLLPLLELLFVAVVAFIVACLH